MILLHFLDSSVADPKKCGLTAERIDNMPGMSGEKHLSVSLLGDALKQFAEQPLVVRV